MELYGFYTGQSFDAYEFLGAHVINGGVIFRVFAPAAAGVCILYGEERSEWWMNETQDGNFYEAYIPDLPAGTPYEYRIYRHNGAYTDHCDPYGFGMELRPAHRSIVRNLSAYAFHDEEWMQKRSTCEDRPLNIYEMHLGSWRKKPGKSGQAKTEGDNAEAVRNSEETKEEDAAVEGGMAGGSAENAGSGNDPVEGASEKGEAGDSPAESASEKGEAGDSPAETAAENAGAQEDWYRYEDLAEVLIPYLKKSGYNYVEFLPLCEHPCDESWGYQNTGFFAPTSRYGDCDGLKTLIDRLHQNGIGAILDFVPVHFAVDSYGLKQFDGTALYEYPNDAVGVSEWGSCNFMHSRGEVRSFLQSSANYWLKEYHFDGLRMDAISRIIYWQGDERRGVNGNAVDFLRVMNRGLKERHQGIILAAEDSTNYPNVTKPANEGGLGFDYKWDMGWMHDTLDYFRTGPEYRTQNYHKLTFSMMYYYGERYLLPYSHDEVVHGKATILQKMNGQYEGKFPQARAMYLYMILHPGKKLNFMGNEIGHFREWDEKREQDWLLLKYPAHDAFYQYMRRLNELYLAHPALFEWDYRQEGFTWLDCHQEGRCIYALRRDSSAETLAAVLNFSNRIQENYSVWIPDAKAARPILYSDWEEYGGGTAKEKEVWDFFDGMLTVTLAPFSGMLFQVKRRGA